MTKEKIILMAKECGIYLEIPKQLEVFYHASRKSMVEELEDIVSQYEGLKAEAYEVFGFDKHRPINTMLDQQAVDVIEWFSASIHEINTKYSKITRSE
jgi:hypothetical protein